jgi:hypothetical protein
MDAPPSDVEFTTMGSLRCLALIFAVMFIAGGIAVVQAYRQRRRSR